MAQALELRGLTKVFDKPAVDHGELGDDQSDPGEGEDRDTGERLRPGPPSVAAQDGLVSPTYDEAKMSAYMKNAELEVSVDVGVGIAKAAMWTCDLTKRYVEINGDYRS